MYTLSMHIYEDIEKQTPYMSKYMKTEKHKNQTFKLILIQLIFFLNS